MKIDRLYNKIKEEFNVANIEYTDFEAKELIKALLNLSETDFLLRRNEDVSDEIICKIEEAIKLRCTGFPLQYIIGEWDFFGRTFKIGEGVLIPRPETELLCQYIIEHLKKIENPIIFDLCSGSGCIAITIKKEAADSTVYAIEKSPLAYKYLQLNNCLICNSGVKIINGDIFKTELFNGLPFADVIVSNPPYIKSAELAVLQKEVKFEPEMALDGGDDGLIFYKYIISTLKKCLKTDGIFAFECGEDQSDDLTRILKNNAFDSIVIKDYNDINRIVIGRRL